MYTVHNVIHDNNALLVDSTPNGTPSLQPSPTLEPEIFLEGGEQLRSIVAYSDTNLPCYSFLSVRILPLLSWPTGEWLPVAMSRARRSMQEEKIQCRVRPLV